MNRNGIVCEIITDNTKTFRVSNAMLHQGHSDAEYHAASHLAFRKFGIDDAPAIEGADHSPDADSADRLINFDLYEVCAE